MVVTGAAVHRASSVGAAGETLTHELSDLVLEAMLGEEAPPSAQICANGLLPLGAGEHRRDLLDRPCRIAKAKAVAVVEDLRLPTPPPDEGDAARVHHLCDRDPEAFVHGGINAVLVARQRSTIGAVVDALFERDPPP